MSVSEKEVRGPDIGQTARSAGEVDAGRQSEAGGLVE